MTPVDDMPAFGSSSAQRTVLIVEDNDDARAALVALLEIEGYLVEAASDGQHAIDVAGAKSPEIALVDIGLPGIDGYEVGRRIRALLGPRVFLIALTGYGQPEDRQKAADAGFDAHLVKPVDPTELTDLLSRGTPGRGSRG
jgi:two-component system, sensor histidine kinase